ncbi:polymer-forming cytoskeletal protein [Halioxenophilus sp. WMMB6]|uniref:bactofilin family protein n=1 Tax=Halioxenophilus sp. WMMB6 TaxID=3073815 RepID=UPI00295EE9B2|nr:polymer-forming cytoskeletal protein [Halioxenophilus sp. WMMB6]
MSEHILSIGKIWPGKSRKSIHPAGKADVFMEELSDLEETISELSVIAQETNDPTAEVPSNNTPFEIPLTPETSDTSDLLAEASSSTHGESVMRNAKSEFESTTSLPTNEFSSNEPQAPIAVLGPKIRLRGELVGEEDLIVQGQIDGTIDLRDNHLTVGKQGIVKANVIAKTVTVEGQVKGDIIGQERIAILASSNVEGNLTAARVVLEDGAKFRGSIDMDVDTHKSEPQKPAAAASAPKSQAVPAAISPVASSSTATPAPTSSSDSETE